MVLCPAAAAKPWSSSHRARGFGHDEHFVDLQRRGLLSHRLQWGVISWCGRHVLAYCVVARALAFSVESVVLVCFRASILARPSWSPQSNSVILRRVNISTSSNVDGLASITRCRNSILTHIRSWLMRAARARQIDTHKIPGCWTEPSPAPLQKTLLRSIPRGQGQQPRHVTVSDTACSCRRKGKPCSSTWFRRLWPILDRRGSPPDDLPFGLFRDCCAFPKSARRGDSTCSRCVTRSMPVCCASNPTFNQTVLLKFKTFTALPVLRLLSLHLTLLVSAHHNTSFANSEIEGSLSLLSSTFVCIRMVCWHHHIGMLRSTQTSVHFLVLQCHVRHGLPHLLNVSQDSEMCNTSV